MKGIVVFYSLEGNCKLIGTTIAESLGFEVLDLKVKNPIPTKGPKKYLIGGRSAITKSSPELETIIPDLSDYELIIVGAPVWAATFAPALRSFATSAHLENKKIAFFTCSAGGPTKKCISDMKTLFSGNEFLSDISFVNPANKNSDACITRAKEWSSTL